MGGGHAQGKIETVTVLVSFLNSRSRAPVWITPFHFPNVKWLFESCVWYLYHCPYGAISSCQLQLWHSLSQADSVVYPALGLAWWYTSTAANLLPDSIPLHSDFQSLSFICGAAGHFLFFYCHSKRKVLAIPLSVSVRLPGFCSVFSFLFCFQPPAV